MLVYVASKWEERARARAVMTQLVEAGHDISFDWTSVEQESAAQAELDRTGVLSADALVLVAEKNLPMRGAWVEFGMACADRIPIYVLGPHAEPCIFLRLPFVHQMSSMQEILDALCESGRTDPDAATPNGRAIKLRYHKTGDGVYDASRPDFLSEY